MVLGTTNIKSNTKYHESTSNGAGLFHEDRRIDNDAHSFFYANLRTRLKNPKYMHCKLNVLSKCHLVTWLRLISIWKYLFKRMPFL